MRALTQPVLGITATALTILLSAGFISLFEFPMFSGWVSYYLLCVVPMQIVVAVIWRGSPSFTAELSQPVKGIFLILFTLFIATVIAITCFFAVGGAVGPPTPMLVMFSIVSVVVTFWGAIMWGGWPFNALLQNPIGSGMLLLAACYLVNYGLFHVFFNYGFMEGTSVYVAALDPGGLFNAWNALVFYVSALAGMFLVLHFDLWPLNKFPALMRQPVLGIVWTALVLILGGIAFSIGVETMGMDPVRFLVSVPVPFIFGTIIVLNMLQGSLFGKLQQPLKGLLHTVSATILGVVLARIYALLMPVITGALDSGPPAYEFEIWLASGLLSVTFPFLIFFAEFLEFWPLKRSEPSTSSKV